MRRGAHGGDQSRQDGPARSVSADPGDPGVRMGGFQTDGESALGVAIERRAQCSQPLHRLASVAGQGARGLDLDQPRARRRRIGRVQGRRIVRRQGRRHPALGPGRGTGLQQGGGRDQQHLARRGLQRGRKTRQTAADDQRPVMSDMAQRPNSK
jgi:hypothetical protein